jgi:hypothetical protein
VFFNPAAPKGQDIAENNAEGNRTDIAPNEQKTVIGFLLLDQRDDQTLTARQVTPLILNGYLVYRIALPTVLSFGVNLAVVPFAGLLNLPSVALIIGAMGSCLLAPMYALFLAAFSCSRWCCGFWCVV